ncbi:hypothetical protein GJ744_010078 [Endocarpon pusillum]|uniref:Uncharacterized protein n=1 Tax=Endocarpon pusillum TaxID=364733 RepID=A0A8H7E396_9EURO|nr:hypothetical protein GJ744_010078 [Endocarpon pusillum]
MLLRISAEVKVTTRLQLQLLQLFRNRSRQRKITQQAARREREMQKSDLACVVWMSQSEGRESTSEMRGRGDDDKEEESNWTDWEETPTKLGKTD